MPLPLFFKLRMTRVIDEFRKLLTMINVLSHGPLKSEEILNCSQTLITLIEYMDKVYFHNMVMK